MAWRESTSMSVDGFDDNDSEKDETKRKSRNLSEKKRRDQFNNLVTELGAMVSASNRKMDKTTVLKTTIAYLRQHEEMSAKNQSEEIQEEWKPSFLSSEEFTQLMLESIDGFILVLGVDGHILFTSESLASLLGYLPASLHNTTLYEIVADSDKIPLYNHLNMSTTADTSADNQLKLSLHIRRSVASTKEEGEEQTKEPQLELVELRGYFRKWSNPEPICSQQGTGYLSDDEISIKSGISVQSNQMAKYRLPMTDRTVFVATCRLVTPQLLRELPVVHQTQTEFTSRHSLEWKYLFLDHRAPPIIGYLPFELLGTSGYDHYHIDDLDQVAACHESLRQTGECTSCYYRFLTKGQQWIWLQSRYYITYHQWNSKPEFIVATHKVVNYKDVLDHASKQPQAEPQNDSAAEKKTHSSFRSGSPTWSSKSSLCGSTGTGFASSSRISQETGDTAPSSYQAGFRQRPRPTSSHHNSEGFSGMQIQLDNAIMSDSMSGMDDCASELAGRSLPPTALVLTPAQQCLQHQLRTKHRELSKRIALQQQELKKLGEQLLLTQQFDQQQLPPLPNPPPPPPLQVISPQQQLQQQQQQQQQLQQRTVAVFSGTDILSLEHQQQRPHPQ